MALIVILVLTTMEALLRDRRLMYVTGKGGVGKTTVAAALGLAAAATRPAHDRLRGRRAGPRARARSAARACGAEERGRARRRTCGRSPSTRSAALEEWLAKQLGGAALRGCSRTRARSSTSSPPRPGAKELITIAKVWELAQLERWDRRNRTYDLVIVDAPASGHGLGDADHAADVRRDRARRADPPPGRQGRRAARRPGADRLRRASPCPRRCRSTRRSSSSAACRDAVGLGLDAIVVNGMWPRALHAPPTSSALRAAARERLRPDATTALRAALPTQRPRPRPARPSAPPAPRSAHAPVVTLPFVFERELGLDDYQRLAKARALARAAAPGRHRRRRDEAEARVLVERERPVHVGPVREARRERPRRGAAGGSAPNAPPGPPPHQSRNGPRRRRR